MTGKTVKLIERILAKPGESLVVCRDLKQAERIARLLEKQGRVAKVMEEKEAQGQMYDRFYNVRPIRYVVQVEAKDD